MSALQLKNELLKMLTETDDVKVLEQLRQYFQGLKNKSITDDELEAEASGLSVESLNVRIEKAEKQEDKSYKEFKKRYGI